jgi:hypothetical protein
MRRARPVPDFAALHPGYATAILRMSWNVASNKLAGSFADPANEIATCRYTIREGCLLAPAATAPRCTARCASHADSYPTNATAATSDAAAAASAGPASAAAPAASATSAATATTACTCEHQTAGEAFMVDEVEGGEADVGEFFLAERRHLRGHEVRPLLKVARRYGRCRCVSR